MEKLTMKVVLQDCRTGKDGVFYADFVFMGGSLSFSVKDFQYYDLCGNEFQITFSLIPRVTTNRFGRMVTVFEPGILTDIEKI